MRVFERWGCSGGAGGVVTDLRWIHISRETAENLYEITVCTPSFAQYQLPFQRAELESLAPAPEFRVKYRPDEADLKRILEGLRSKDNPGFDRHIRQIIHKPRTCFSGSRLAYALGNTKQEAADLRRLGCSPPW